MRGFVNDEESGRYGGLSELRLVAVKDVLEVKYDKASGCFTELLLVAGASAVRYDFEEDSAFYRQMLIGTYPYEKVSHELFFRLPYLDASVVGALADLQSASPAGFVAVAVTSSGDAFLAGWSVEFGGEAPLRLLSVKADTCADYADDSYCTVELRSEDISFSKSFTGVDKLI